MYLTRFAPLVLRRMARVFALAALCLVAFAPAYAPARAEVEDVLKQIQREGAARVVVRMKADRGDAAWSARAPVARQRAAVAAALEQTQPSLRRAHIGAYRSFRTLPLLAATVTHEQLMSLMAEPEVDQVYLVRQERKTADAKLDSSGRTLESAQVSSSIAAVDAQAAWAKGYDGTGYAVAVIDGGFNFEHPMLKGKNVGDACFGSDFGTSTTNNCPGGKTPLIAPGAASSCPLTSSRCGHGTHVASVAAGNDGTNFGVARGAKIVPIDVFSSDSLASDCAPDATPCELTDSLAVLDALDYINEHAADLHIAAVNISIGGTARDGYCDDDPRKSVIDMLRQKGIAVVAAASNDGYTGKVSPPACISSAIGVGATNDGTTVASFSNFASTLDLMAPGVGVLGASGGGVGIISSSGTSSAAPHVAGAWTVLRQAFPTATFDQLDSALKQTGIPVTRTGSGITVPKIQVMAAIYRLQGQDRRIVNSMVSANAPVLGQSYLRFFNNSTAAGTVTVTLHDAQTGASVSTWTSPLIPPQAAPQISFETIEREAVLAQGASAKSGRVYYNVDVASTFSGYMQHVLWARLGGVFANLTSCASGPVSDTSVIPNVHASSFTNFVSRLRIVNTGPATDHAVLRVIDAVTGNELAQWTSPDIQAGATLELTSAQLESQVDALRARVGSGLLQYNVRLTNLVGYLQHVVENTQVGALVDMSAKCALGLASN